MLSRRLNFFVLLVVFSGMAWISWNVYTYFFYLAKPHLSVHGIEEDGWYAGEAKAFVRGSDNYKVGTISLLLDGKPLIVNHKINKTSFEYPFTIPTQTLNNGKHTLEAVLENKTYNRTKNFQEVSFNVDNVPLLAAFVKSDDDIKVFQGKTLHIQFQVNKEIKEAKAVALSREIVCVPESERSLIYECFVPVDCEDTPSEYILNIEIADKVGNKLLLDKKFQVVRFPFKKQRIKLNPEKVKIENETGLPEKELESELLRLSKESPSVKMWNGIFYTPVEISDPKQITTEFGMIRATQEKGLYMHKAIDVYNTPKSVIWAPQDGKVVLMSRYAHSGNTLVIDHGCGILSMYYHLDSFANLNVGDKIKKGNPLGTLGNTGYATGYHLHWELRNNNVAVDPLEWTKQSF